MPRGCARCIGQILNQTELGRDVGLAQPTVHRWLNLLEMSYLLVRLPAYAVHRTKRLVKSPRVFWGDTGVALHLGAMASAGAHLKNLVLQDLLACAHRPTFRQDYGRKARAGILLHTGRTVKWLAPYVLAVPWWRVL